MRLYPAQNYIPVDAVKKNLLQRLFYTKSGIEKHVFSATIIAEEKPSFNIYNSANPMKSKQLALITELFCPYMEPRCHVSKGKTGGSEAGKRDYRHHSRSGCSNSR
jgi:hypothetical protein